MNDLDSQLAQAATSGNLPLCQKLVAQGANPTAQEGTAAFIPLWSAAVKGHQNITEYFLKVLPAKKVEELRKTLAEGHYLCPQISQELHQKKLRTQALQKAKSSEPELEP